MPTSDIGVMIARAEQEHADFQSPRPDRHRQNVATLVTMAKSNRTNRTPKKGPEPRPAAKRHKPTKRKPAKASKPAPRARTAPDWAPAFLDVLSKNGNIKAACSHAKVGRTTVYDRRDTDPAFAEAMAEALDDSTDLLELEARRRAYFGVQRPVFGSGGPGQGTVQVGQTQEYSDTLLIFLLKAHRPEKFRDNVKHEFAGRVGVDVKTDMTDDERLARLAELAQRAVSRRPGPTDAGGAA